MITKAIIKKLPSGAYTKNGKLVYNNQFDVFIPIFLNAGENEKSPSCAANMKATLCYTPGSVNNYKVGDVVYVSFENNLKSSPIILGKLYLGYDDTTTNLSTNDVLKVSSQAELPIDTKIGDISGEDLAKLFREFNNLENRFFNKKLYQLCINDTQGLIDLPLAVVGDLFNIPFTVQEINNLWTDYPIDRDMDEDAICCLYEIIKEIDNAYWKSDNTKITISYFGGSKTCKIKCQIGDTILVDSTLYYENNEYSIDVDIKDTNDIYFYLKEIPM